jgi:UDP-N-acetylglucosamine 2-epimerase (non-hydrolysing)
MNIDIIYGTRPEIIKLAPLILELKKNNAYRTTVTFSGQHLNMVKPYIEWFEIQNDYELNAFLNHQTLGKLSSNILEKYSENIIQNKIDLVIVQGDTITSLMGAQAAFLNGKNVIHVEAGLRSGNNKSPFPEEISRKMISSLADWHFCPTELNKENLKREGISENVIEVVGNTVVDSIHFTLKKNKENNFKSVFAEFILLTLHRRESWDRSLTAICEGIYRFCSERPTANLVIPLHKNEIVRKQIQDVLGNLKNVTLTEQLEYKEMISALAECKFVLTDSGGIQEEAVTLNKKVFVARDESDRPEALKTNLCEIVGRDSARIYSKMILEFDKPSSKNANDNITYGDGFASKRIVLSIEKFVSNLK